MISLTCDYCGFKEKDATDTDEFVPSNWVIERVNVQVTNPNFSAQGTVPRIGTINGRTLGEICKTCLDSYLLNMGVVLADLKGETDG